MLDDIVSFLFLFFPLPKYQSSVLSDGLSVYNLCFDAAAFMKVGFWYGLFSRQVQSCQATLIFFFFLHKKPELRCS